MIFWQKLKREGVTKHIVKNRNTLYALLLNLAQPRNSVSFCLHPIPQKLIRNDFLTKVGDGGEGVTKHIVKNRSTLFCMIYYSIWPNQGTLCLSVCTPDPQKVMRIIENVNSRPKIWWFLSKILGEGGRSTWSTLCQPQFG